MAGGSVAEDAMRPPLRYTAARDRPRRSPGPTIAEEREIVGPVVGSQGDWSHLDVAVDGDPLGVIVEGGSVGCARRLVPGDIMIGAAIYVEENLALVRLSRPMPYRSGAGGIY